MKKNIFLVCIILLATFLNSNKGWGQSIVIDNSNFPVGNYGQNSTIAVPIKVNGCFADNNVFQLYISGDGFLTEQLIGSFNTYFTTFINGIIPNNLIAGNNYSLRVKSTNPVIVSTPTTSTIQVTATSSTLISKASPEQSSRILNDQLYFGWCTGSADNNSLNLQNQSSVGATVSSILINEKTSVVTNPIYSSNLSSLVLNRNYYTYIIKADNGSFISTKAYNIINSPNRLGLSTDGEQNGCLPDTLSFTVSIDASSGGIGDNFPLQKYKIEWGDNTAPEIYKHCQLLSTNGLIQHLYSSTSCSKLNISFPVTTTLINTFYAVSGTQTQQNCEQPVVTTRAKIFQKPTASFTFTTPRCVGSTVTFTNTSSPGVAQLGTTCVNQAVYTWYLDGVQQSQSLLVSTTPNFTYTFNTAGSYTIKLTVDNGSCGIATKTEIICIQPNITTAFNFNDNGVFKDSIVDCAPKNFAINNTTPTVACGQTSFTWVIMRESDRSVIAANAGIYSYTNSTNNTSQNPSFNFTTPGRYLIKLTSSNTCKTDTLTRKIIINGTTGVSLPSNVTYCANGKTIDFGADVNHKPTYSSSGGAGETYNWTVSGGNYTVVSGTLTSQYPVINFIDNVTYTINLTFTNNCGTQSTSQTITFLSAVTANVGVNPKTVTVCYNENTIQLNGAATGGYSSVLWSSNRNGTFSNSAILNPIYTFGSTDRSNLTTRLILTVTPSNAACQVVKDTLNITIRPQNTVTSVSSKSVCSGSNVSYTPTAFLTGSTFSWTSTTVTGTVTGLSASGTGNINDVLTNSSNSSDATVRYSIVPIKDGCNGDTLHLLVTVKPKPILTATPNATIICSGQSLTVNLTSTVSGATYTWSSSANGNISGNTNQATATSTASFTHNLSTTSTSDITLTYTINSSSNNCAADVQTVVVTVKPGVSTSNAGGDQKLCNATTATLAGSNPTVGTGVWTQVGTPVVTIANPSLFNTGISGLTPNNTYRFVWTIAGTGSCPNSTDTVEIVNRPSITIANAGLDDKVCDFTTTSNNTYTLAANIDISRNYESGLWTFVSAQNGATLSSTTIPNATITFTQPGTYELKWTISNGGACTPTSDNVIIKVYAKPVGGTTAANASVCKNNNSGTINLTGKTGKVTKWQYAIGSSNNWIDTSVTANSINYLNLDTTRRYRAMIESDGKADGCQSIDSSTVTTITVDAETVAGITLKDTSVCGTTNSGNIVLTNYVGSITKWEYSTDGGTIWLTVSPNNTTATLNFTNLTTTTKYRAVVKSGSCSALNSTVSTVTVNAGTSAANAGPDAKLCAVSSFTLQGTAPSVGTGTWTQVGTPTVTIQSPTSPTTNITGLQPNNSYTFVFTVAGFASCPTSTDTVILLNRPALTQANAGNDSIICNFTSTTNNQFALNGNGTSLSFEKGTWSIINQPTGGNGNFTNPNLATSNFTFSKAGTYTLQWSIGNDAATCPSTKDTVIFKVIDKIVAGTLSASSLNICSGNPVTITNQNYTGQVQLWQFKRPYTQVTWTDTLVQSPTITFSNVTDTFLVRSKVVTLDSINCTSVEYTTQLQINVAPPSNPGTTGTNKTECKGTNSGTITLAGFTGIIVRWESSINNGVSWTSISNTTATQTYLNLNQTTMYRAVVKSGTCAEAFSTATTITIVNPVTAPNAGADVKLCNANTVTLLGNTPASNETGTWSLVVGNPVNFSATNTPSTTITGLQVGSYTFQWTINNNVCSPQSDQVDVIVYPSINNTITTTSQTICATQPVTITGDLPTGGNAPYTYSWQQSTDNINWTNIVPVQAGQSLTFTPTASIYLRRIVSANPCTSTSLSAYIIVQPAITNNSLSANQSICINTAAAAIIGSTPTGGNGNFAYQWQQSINGGITWTTITNATTKDYSPGVLTQTTYYRRIVTTDLCSGSQGNTSQAVIVTVNPDAKALFTFSKDKDCAPFNINNAIIQPSVLPLQNGSYNWYANNNSIGVGTVFPGYQLISPGDSIIIKLVTISQFGCKNDSMEHKFYTVPKPATAFTLSDTVGCGPLLVSFVNTTPNITWFTYQWNFGNGVTSTAIQPNAVSFATNPNFSDTTYIVSLKAITSCESVTFTKTVRVKSKPKAIITPNKSVGCSPLTVTFSNLSKGIGVNYIWNFDDGTIVATSTNAAQTHTFNSGVQDTFDVKLIAINECGRDTAIYKIVVSPNQVRLDFAINGNQSQGCKPHAVSFINASSGATNFQWNFGDGNTLSTIKNIDTVTYTFLQSGTFIVTLYATNGCSDTTSTETIQIFNPPLANFTATPLSACIGDTIRFFNQSDTTTSLLWNFRDGYTSTLTNPTHAFATAGVYNVQLKAIRQYNSGLSCTDTINRAITIVSKLPGLFSVSDSISNCVPFTVTFTNNSLPSSLTVWTFAPGVTDTGNVVTHTFAQVGTYNVKMVTKHPAGCTYEASKNIVVRGPSGSLQYDHGFICGNTPVRFSANTLSTDSIRWNFGDGTFLTSTSTVVYHTYTNAGLYLPSATLLSNIYGACSVGLQGTDTIKVDYIKAGFRYAEQKVCGSTTVQFTDTSRSYFAATSWKWNFGDGTFSNAQNPLHTYSSTNTWQVQLIVTSASGCSDTLIKALFIKVNSKPVANINAPVTACTSRPIPYQAQIFSADSVTVINWSFSNGLNTNGLVVNNIYVNAGTYTATLITGTLYGCQDTISKTISINPSPNIIASPDVSICKGQATQLNVTGTTSYSWSPLNGTLSCTTCNNPLANPLTTTQYVVTGTNSFGCTAIDTIIVTVAQPIDIVTSPNDTICIGQSAQLNVTGATTYAWSPAATLSSAVSATPVATPTLTTQYRVIGFDSYNCFQDTAYVVVAVGQYPTVSLGPDKILPTGTPLPLTTVVTNGPITKWVWGPSAATLSCNDCPLPIATIKREVCYSVEATNLYKCAARDTLCVKVFCEGTQVFIPNAFTPDGDGVNDILMVRAQGIRTVKNFRIFNRWGQVVFERNNFAPNDVAAGWDGTVGGKPASPDVYVYTCEVVCENDISYTYKGNVSIVK